MEQADLRQLLNTSWTLHRLSPLHHGKDCETLLDNPAALKTYATRLRDQLTGDILAGIHASIGTTEDDALSKTGALKECHWQPISGRLSQRDATSRSPETDSIPGILVTLEYENIVYKAALLADTESESETQNQNQRKGSTSLPLLLTRLPNPLRQTFITFLSSNFDTYCALLRLPSNFLCAGLEAYVDVLRNNSGSESADLVEEAIKELQLTLSFSPSIAPALRAVNISVSRSSLAGFLREPTQPYMSTVSRNRRTLGEKLRSPLIGNLTSYLETHLAMQLDLDGSSNHNHVAKQHVRLSKVACAAFVLGSEGRMKLVGNTRRGEQDGNDGDNDAPGVERNQRNQLALQASETLLRAVLRRAGPGDQHPAS